jgi:queuosine biosynthesis protein QueC
MPKHVFLCGLSDTQRQDFVDAQVLSMDSSLGNLTLRLDALRKVLAGAEPSRLTDFVEIASYVFAADRNTKRGTEILKNMAEAWRREFLLVVAIRDLEFWNRAETKNALTAALGFASEDTWSFDFLLNSSPNPLQQYLEIVEREANTGGGTSIVLFSGGLDSLAGAVHELQATNRHVILISHRSTPWIGGRQAALARRLQEAFPRRVTHVVVDNKMKAGLDDREETQRTRSFFFLAIAAVAGVIERSDCIRFFENGIMSMNLPIATQVVGARASRSTHPKTLHLFQRLLSLMMGTEVVVDNPFIWLTKAEVVRQLSDSCQRPLITLSFSCSRSRAASTFKPHCGNCIQCIQRRIATLGAGAGDVDEADGYETDIFRGALEDGEDRAMVVGAVSLALECARIDPRQFLSRFAGEIAQIAQAYPPAEKDEAALKTVELFRRHGETVRDILTNAVRTHAEAFVDKTLPTSSLLALVGQGNIADVPRSTVS